MALICYNGSMARGSGTDDIFNRGAGPRANVFGLDRVQRQDGTRDQMASLIFPAEQAGLYDAADWLNENGPRKAGVPSSAPGAEAHRGTLPEQLKELDKIAVEQGCYDVSDLIRYHLAHRPL